MQEIQKEIEMQEQTITTQMSCDSENETSDQKTLERLQTGTQDMNSQKRKTAHSPTRNLQRSEEHKQTQPKWPTHRSKITQRIFLLAPNHRK